MKNKLISAIIFLLASLTSVGQKQADLTKAVKTPADAAEAIDEINKLAELLGKKFIAIANNPNTKTHKEIQDFFGDYRLNHYDTSEYVYPNKITKANVTIQYVDYETSHGWVGQTFDSAYNESELTALIFIPVFDIFHKGKAVEAICFKATLLVYSEGNLKTNKNYMKEVRLEELKKIDF